MGLFKLMQLLTKFWKILGKKLYVDGIVYARGQIVWARGQISNFHLKNR